ncbi:MAG: fibronectin type III domain-containing protein [Acidobacteriota bacterium]|nr:fibronectin type III domain-containing protein [Acidobacteriota bacterium]MDQ5835848.1 fibronectin type III domain-containing protein [Acidobacteriota bacterium]
MRHAVGLSNLPEPAAQATPTLQLSKEYVYAGGRLVATEEPTPLPSGPPPTNLAAATTSINPPAATVRVTWAAPSSGAPLSYVVERKAAGGQFQPVGQPVTAPATSFDDTSAGEGAAYLYQVKAVYAGGGTSGYSNTDLATTVAFSDDPLVGANDPHSPATPIRARHLTELRRAVSAVHALAGMGAVTAWTYPDPVSAPASQRRPVYKEDVQDLRARLSEALPVLGITPPTYDGITKYFTKVQAAHFQQLRDAVK